jgi:hypothetical protein
LFVEVFVSYVAASAPLPVWSLPEFWITLPLLLMVLLLGVIGSLALLRARREDVPNVLAIFVRAFNRLSDRLPAQDVQRDDDKMPAVKGEK